MTPSLMVVPSKPGCRPAAAPRRRCRRRCRCSTAARCWSSLRPQAAATVASSTPSAATQLQERSCVPHGPLLPSWLLRDVTSCPQLDSRLDGSPDGIDAAPWTRSVRERPELEVRLEPHPQRGEAQRLGQQEHDDQERRRACC